MQSPMLYTKHIPSHANIQAFKHHFESKHSFRTAPRPHQMRVSSRRSLLPSRPMHALRNASSALRWRLRLLTTSVPGLTSGALSMYESSESTEYSGAKSAPADASRYLTRVSSSVRIVRSRMSGVARSESYKIERYQRRLVEKKKNEHTSHSLKMLIVERPPQKISE